MIFCETDLTSDVRWIGCGGIDSQSLTVEVKYARRACECLGAGVRVYVPQGSPSVICNNVIKVYDASPQLPVLGRDGQLGNVRDEARIRSSNESRIVHHHSCAIE